MAALLAKQEMERRALEAQFLESPKSLSSPNDTLPEEDDDEDYFDEPPPVSATKQHTILDDKVQKRVIAEVI
jgi:hypothetical protein